MSASWGSVCSMLTVVNPIAVTACWEFVRKYVINVCHHTEHGNLEMINVLVHGL